MINIGIIGGGAAGFFSAINAAENYPDARVVIFEKSNKLLSKVRISGGGRCNVTNGSTSVKEVSESYPRGRVFMKKALNVFNNSDIVEWFEQRGVPLKKEPDQRIFPVSDNSESIIACLKNEISRLNIEIRMGMSVLSIKPVMDGIELELFNCTEHFDKVIVASGGSPKMSGLEWLSELGHKIENPVPSLFTFNIPNDPVTNLMGISMPDVSISIQGTKLKSSGALLITHWGMSGPAVLKLSAFGARLLAGMDYQFVAQINWTGIQDHFEVLNQIRQFGLQHPKKMIINARPFELPERLWRYLLSKSNLDESKQWINVGKKEINKIVATLTNDFFQVKGKTTFKEEFVTCGGISLESIHHETMESKVCPNLYFAGEVLDIDGVTGGFNFQSAWTTAYIAAQLHSVKT